jgi:PKD repeat protein
LRVRQLERRRVLAASVTDIFFAPVDLDAGTAAHDSNEGTQITATASVGGDGPLSYDWKLMEGATTVAQSSATSFTFTPPDDGNYTVTLDLMDAESSASRTEDVVIHNVRPVLHAAPNQTVFEGSKLDLSGVGAPPLAVYVDNGKLDTHTVSVDWGDGSATETPTIFPGPGVGALGAKHTYVENGVYEVQVTITDDDGGTDMKSFFVDVKNRPPVLIVAPDQTVDEGALLDLTAMGGGFPLGAFIDDGILDTHTVTVNWGDGSATEPATVLPGAPGSGAILGSHTYADDGMYQVKVTVADDDGGMAMQSFMVAVNNVNPVLVVPPDQMVDEGVLLDLTGMGGGFPLGAFIDDGILDTHTVTVNWGDGSATEPATVLPGAPGSGAILGSHTYADDGMYQVKVTVTDDDGGMAMQTFMVTVKNVAPTVTISGLTSVDEGDENTWTIGPVVDPGDDTVSQYIVHWGDGDTDIFTTAELDGMGRMVSHTYVEGPNNYTITVDLVDEDAEFDAVDTLDVTVNNVPPVLVVAPDQMVNEGALLDLTGMGAPPLGAFIDAGILDTHTVTVNWGDGSATEPATVLPGAPGSGAILGSHTYADDGVYEVKVTVTDDDGGMDMESFFVTVKNVPPVLVVAPDQMVNEGSLLDLTGMSGGFPLGGFIDDGILDTHTVTVNWGDGTPTEPATVLPGAPGSGAILGSHTYADDGVYEVKVTITDDDGGMDMESFFVTVTNVAPTLGVTPSAAMIDEGSSVDFTAMFSDAGFDNPANPTTPATGDPLAESFRYFVDWGDGRDQVPNEAVSDTNGGPGVPSNGSFGGSHTYADDGTYTVTIRIADDNMSGNFASGVAGIDFVEQTFDIVVKNVNPTLTVTPNAASVNEGSSFGFGATFSDPGFDNSNNTNPTAPPAIGNPLAESFRYFVDWGDGRDQVPNEAVADTNGGVGTNSTGNFSGTHTYADNGTYTVKVRIADDNMTGDFAAGVAGVDFVEQTFTIVVNNVDPTLTGTASVVVNEGQQFTLGGLGIGLEDPGFDNPLNTLDPANGGELMETFEVTKINWGDGSIDDNADSDASDPITIVDRVSGGVGTTTKAGFDHAAHAYADNGTYTITITIKDDDGNLVDRQFTIQVNNVAPSLTLTNQSFVLNEGSTLTIGNLGTFSDPGFNNPLNPNAQPGGSVETFHYTINWGDGTVETMQPVATSVNGSQGVLTTGTISDSHTYEDNDADNKYTITVTLFDDDGDSVQQSFEITVLNVNPTLFPVFATDINAKTGSTTLTLTFLDPGADEFQIMVDWGDMLSVPDPADRFVVAANVDGSTPQTLVLVHNYDGPPDPDNPTADIVITVKVRDDDFQTLGVVQPGESNLEAVAISNPGIQTTNVAIDTTPDVPRLDLTVLPTQAIFSNDQASATQVLQRQDVRGSGGEVAATTERYLELRLVYPDGTESIGYRIKDEALLDLRAFFRTLPDGRYRIYLIRSETKIPRLVIEVDVRRGRVIDVSDDSEGTRDRPPTGEAEEAATAEQEQTTPQQPAVPLEANPLLEAVPVEEGQGDKETTGQREEDDSLQASMSPGLLVSLSAAPWSKRVDAALSEADDRTALRLRRAARRRRLLAPIAS